jgi:hypothetical protein
MEIRELQRNWELFGKTDPLWSILTDPRARHGRWDEEEFFRSGKRTIDAVFRKLTELRARPRRGLALDFGCGVGRLTQALARRFRRVIGVDIAPAMIDLANQYNRSRWRCSYAVNDRPDLAMFPDGKFDFVFTLIVLQHMVPEYSRRYVAEFLRVAKPGGIIVFQVPSAIRIDPRFELSQRAFQAAIAPVGPLAPMTAGTRRSLRFRVTNVSSSEWGLSPMGLLMTLNLGNHWLDTTGTTLVRDDGRATLRKAVAPGETMELDLFVRAPAQPGSYLLEVDLVQENVSWFGARGSPTWRAPVEVFPADAAVDASAPEAPCGPRMEMHCLARSDIERLIPESGGELLSVIEHDSCGTEFENYQYFVRKPSPPSLLRRVARHLPPGVRSRLKRMLLVGRRP